MAKYSQGQSVTRNLSASGLNRMTDVAEWFAQTQATGKPSTRSQFIPPSTDLIKIRNDSGGNRRLGEVLGLTDRITVDGPKDWWIGAEELDDTTARTHQYVVLLENIPDGSIGWAQYSGICPALVNFSSASHRIARAESGETVLQGITGGAEVSIISKPAGTSELLCLVHLRHAQLVQVGKTAETIAKGSNGDVRLYYANDYGAETDSGVDIQVRNLFGDADEDRWCAFIGTHGVFYMIALECGDDYYA